MVDVPWCIPSPPPALPSSPQWPPLAPHRNDDYTILAALPINVGALCACVLLYILLHFIFYPQYYVNPLQRGVGPQPPPNRRPFAALWLVMHMSDDAFEEHAGLDALALLEFIRLALRIFVGYGVYGLSVGLLSIWAANHLGSVAENRTWDGPPGDLALLSLANLRSFPQDLADARWDRWLGSIGSVLGCWYLTGLTIWQLKRSWRRILARRQRSLKDARDTSSLALLVRSKKRLRFGTKMPTRAETLAMWSSLYPGEIYDVRVIRDTGKLPQLLARRKKLVSSIEKLEAKAARIETRGGERSPRFRPSIALEMVRGRNKQLAKTQNALEAQRAELEQVMKDVRSDYELCTAPDSDAGPNYFVLFRRHRPCNIAKQVLNTRGMMEVYPAPLVADVRWASLRPSAERVRLPLRLAGIAFYYAMLCVYMLPIGIVSGLLELDVLTRSLPFLEPLVGQLGPSARGFLTAFLPTLALIAFIALLPMICHYIAGIEGPISLSQQSREAFHRLYLFQFVWVFLGVTIGSTGLALVENLQEIAQNPISILDRLGGKLAGSSVFFMVYLSMQFGYGLPVKELTRIVPIGFYLARNTATRAANAAQAGAEAARVASKKAGAAIKRGSLAIAAASFPMGGVSPSNTPEISRRAVPNKSGASIPEEGGEEAGEDSRSVTRRDDAPVPPEQFPYALNWCNVMLATTLGLCYCSIQPIAILFGCFYLALAYIFFKRGLVFSYTHASESRGAFWPAASERLLLILFFAQLMLTGVHWIKLAVPTAICIALTMPVTYVANRYFRMRFERQLDVLPLIASAGTDEADEEMEHEERKTMVSRLSTADGISIQRASLIALCQQEERKYTRLFAGYYTQPELLEAAELLKDKDAHRKFSVTNPPPGARLTYTPSAMAMQASYDRLGSCVGESLSYDPRSRLSLITRTYDPRLDMAFAAPSLAALGATDGNNVAARYASLVSEAGVATAPTAVDPPAQEPHVSAAQAGVLARVAHADAVERPFEHLEPVNVEVLRPSVAEGLPESAVHVEIRR